MSLRHSKSHLCACARTYTHTHTKTNSLVRKFLCLLWASRISGSVIDVEGVIATWDHNYKSQSLSCRKKVNLLGMVSDGTKDISIGEMISNLLFVCHGGDKKCLLHLLFFWERDRPSKKSSQKAYLFGGRRESNGSLKRQGKGVPSWKVGKGYMPRNTCYSQPTC